MPVTGNATPGTSGVNRPATLLPPTSTDVETQMESLIVSVEQMRALFAQTGGNGKLCPLILRVHLTIKHVGDSVRLLFTCLLCGIQTWSVRGALCEGLT